MLDELRTADLATTAPSGEIAVVLPNTSSETARVVVERLASAFPEAEINEASYETGDTPETLVERARQTQRG